MHFALKLSQTQKLAYSLEQKMEMLQECRQVCQSIIESLRSSIGLGTEQIAPSVFDAVTLLASSQLRDHVVTGLVAHVLGEDTNRAYMVSNVGRVVQALGSDFVGFAGEAVVDGLDHNSMGNIYIPGLSRDDGAPRGRVHAALFDWKNAERSALEDEELFKERASTGEDTQGLQRELSEKRAALEIASHIAPTCKLLAGVLDTVFRIKDAEGRPILGDFFREADLMRSLDWQVSERIIRRFVARFCALKRNAGGYEYADAMMNTISEFVMVSLGIVEPELFRKMHGEVRELDVLFADQNVDESTNGKASIVLQMRKLGLVSNGALHWCRWAVPGAKLCANTDEAIRHLMREVIGASKEQTLERFGFTPFIKELREAKANHDRQDISAVFGEILTARLGSKEFREYLQECCVQRWYPKLKQFLNLHRVRREE